MFMRLNNRLISLRYVKMIDLIEKGGKQKIIFHFTDGSRFICSKKINEKNKDFEEAWNTLKNPSIFVEFNGIGIIEEDWNV